MASYKPAQCDAFFRPTVVWQTWEHKQTNLLRQRTKHSVLTVVFNIVLIWQALLRKCLCLELVHTNQSPSSLTQHLSSTAHSQPLPGSPYSLAPSCPLTLPCTSSYRPVHFLRAVFKDKAVFLQYNTMHQNVLLPELWDSCLWRQRIWRKQTCRCQPYHPLRSGRHRSVA